MSTGFPILLIKFQIFRKKTNQGMLKRYSTSMKHLSPSLIFDILFIVCDNTNVLSVCEVLLVGFLNKPLSLNNWTLYFTLNICVRPTFASQYSYMSLHIDTIIVNIFFLHISPTNKCGLSISQVLIKEAHVT